MTTYVFRDTEWADELACELVSLALVSEDASSECYAEIDPLPPHPKPFAADVVYPLLERGARAFPRDALADEVSAFLLSLAQPAVLADHPNDLRLLRCLLDGAHWHQLTRHGLIVTKMHKDSRMRALSEAWFASHPDYAARRHHALTDAQALRYAWLVVTGRASAQDASELGVFLGPARSAPTHPP